MLRVVPMALAAAPAPRAGNAFAGQPGRRHPGRWARQAVLSRHSGRAAALAVVASVLAMNCVAQNLPVGGTTPTAPDQWLLTAGPSWYYRAAPSPTPRELTFRRPDSAEEEVVSKAKTLLANSSAKAMALVNGNEVVWYGFKPPAGRNNFFHGFSMGKTITALAVGQAICQDKLKLNSLAADVVPELRAADIGQASVRDLLRMASGTWEGNKDSTVWSKEEREAIDSGRSDWLQFLATSRAGTAEQGLFGKRKPGSDFAYRSTDPLALALVLEKATGTSYAQWIEDQVLHPAGTASPAVVGQDRKGHGQGDGTVRMTLEDWIRLAVWVKQSEGAQGCFGDFVRAATQTQITDRAKTQRIGYLGYGYLTWAGTLPNPASYWAAGYGGQRIAWNRSNARTLVAFSNVENYMDDVIRLYADWARLP